jgi:hypothetical protein
MTQFRTPLYALAAVSRVAAQRNWSAMRRFVSTPAECRLPLDLKCELRQEG